MQGIPPIFSGSIVIRANFMVLSLAHVALQVFSGGNNGEQHTWWKSFTFGLENGAFPCSGGVFRLRNGACSDIRHRAGFAVPFVSRCHEYRPHVRQDHIGPAPTHARHPTRLSRAPRSAFSRRQRETRRWSHPESGHNTARASLHASPFPFGGQPTQLARFCSHAYSLGKKLEDTHCGLDGKHELGGATRRLAPPT